MSSFWEPVALDGTAPATKEVPTSTMSASSCGWVILVYHLGPHMTVLQRLSPSLLYILYCKASILLESSEP